MKLNCLTIGIRQEQVPVACWHLDQFCVMCCSRIFCEEVLKDCNYMWCLLLTIMFVEKKVSWPKDGGQATLLCLLEGGGGGAPPQYHIHIQQQQSQPGLNSPTRERQQTTATIAASELAPDPTRDHRPPNQTRVQPDSTFQQGQTLIRLHQPAASSHQVAASS